MTNNGQLEQNDLTATRQRVYVPMTLGDLTFCLILGGIIGAIVTLCFFG